MADESERWTELSDHAPDGMLFESQREAEASRSEAYPEQSMGQSEEQPLTNTGRFQRKRKRPSRFDDYVVYDL